MIGYFSTVYLVEVYVEIGNQGHGKGRYSQGLIDSLSSKGLHNLPAFCPMEEYGM